MSKVRVSVIIPCFNAERTIKNCINSILSQTERNIEVLVVDDGSTDKTLDILKNIKDSRLTVFNQKNSGVSVARNLGLKHAKGEFISFVDADDWLDLQFYEHMLWNQGRTRADLIECGRVDVEGAKITPRPTCKQDVVDITVNPDFINKGSLFVWDKLFKRDIISENNIHFPEHIGYAEDAIFLVEYKLNIKTISYVHKCIYNYRISLNSASKSNKKLNDIIKGMEELLTLITRYGKFRELVPYIGDMAAGYYSRKIIQLPQSSVSYQERVQFVRDFINFFESYIPNWKIRVCKYRSSGSNFKKSLNEYRTSEIGVKFFWRFQKIKDFLIKTCAPFILYNRVKKVHANIDDYYKFRNKPIEANTVLMLSFFGSGFNDSIFHLAKYAAINRKDLKILIGSNYPCRDRNFARINGLNINFVDINSRSFIEALATSKYLITNSRFPKYFSKREDQIAVNLWHGTPLKTLGRSINKGLKDLGNNQNQFLMSDLILAPNEFTKQIFERDYSLRNEIYRGEVFLCGYPRNDAFIEQNTSFLENKKCYAYMPTWRGDTIETKEIDRYKKSIERIFEKLDRLISDDVILFVKLHQVVMNKINIRTYKHIKPFDNRFDTYEFLNKMDGLVSDYSSVFFDFMNTNKPICLFTYDRDEYLKTRGVYFSFKELPFDMAMDVESLASFLNRKQHTIKYLDFKNRFCSFDTGGNSKAVFEKMLSHKTVTYKSGINCYLMPQISSKEREDIIKSRLNDRNGLFIFAQETFTPHTERVLHKYNSQINYIVVPIKDILPTNRVIQLYLAKRFSIFNTRKLRNICANIVIPGISPKTIKNYSNYPIFEILGNTNEK